MLILYTQHDREKRRYLGVTITTLVPKQDWAGTAGHVLVGTPGKTLEYCKKRWVKCDAARLAVLICTSIYSCLYVHDIE